MLAETVPHRARFVWLSAIVVATLALITATHPRRHHHHRAHASALQHQIGHCHEGFVLR